MLKREFLISISLTSTFCHLLSVWQSSHSPSSRKPHKKITSNWFCWDRCCSHFHHNFEHWNYILCNISCQYLSGGVKLDLVMITWRVAVMWAVCWGILGRGTRAIPLQTVVTPCRSHCEQFSLDLLSTENSPYEASRWIFQMKLYI